MGIIIFAAWVTLLCIAPPAALVLLIIYMALKGE